MTSKPTTNPLRRLESLDILRGFDLFLLVFLQPVIIAVGNVWHPEWLQPVLHQFDHEVWEGFRCWDLVMPLFLFMTGTAMPFSFAKYASKGASPALYRKIGRRFLLLFLLGMVVQGNLLGFDFDRIYFYTNTLQAIATGYLLSALIILHCGVRTQIILTIVLLAVYSLPMHLWGDFTREGSFANMIDSVVLGRFRGDPSYTWLWSSLTFGVTVMLGTFAGRIIRNAGAMTSRTALTLAAIGVGLIAGGELWGLHQPIIKRLWTGSMTLYSGGWCFMLMALSYWWIDVCGHRRGLEWLKIYGMNSIAAYILGEVVNFRSIASSLTYGLAPRLGDFYPAWLTFCNFLIVFLILRHLYRHRVFLKI